MSCRLSNYGVVEEPAAFRSLACAQCLYFIYIITYKDYNNRLCPAGLAICDVNAECDCDDASIVYNIPQYTINQSAITELSKLRAKIPSLSPAYEYLVGQCCQAAAQCCETVLAPSEKSHAEFVCPATWDGWHCFEASNPRQIKTSCPPYIYGDRYREHDGEHTSKMCMEDGWQKITEWTDNQTTEWTNYLGCHMKELGGWAQIKKTAAIMAYAMSVLAIIPALIIIASFRSLRAQSVFVIHNNLLISFLLVSVFYLFNNFFFIVDGAPGEDLFVTNHLSCRILFTMQLRFARMATYTWMLAEGVYLFRLLFRSFADNENLATYKIVCWGIPFLMTMFYSLLRILYDNETCWVPNAEPAIEAVMLVPCLLCLFANTVLVAIILYVLIKKLRYNPHLEPMSYRKAVRAAVMLVPVFGLHLLFTIVRIDSNSAHQIINIAMDGLQGLAVSVILCYANNGVAERVKSCLKSIEEARSLRRECRAHSNAFIETKSHITRFSTKKQKDLPADVVCPILSYEVNGNARTPLVRMNRELKNIDEQHSEQL